MRKPAVAPSQSGKFKQAASDLECDEDEAYWDERLKKIAELKPNPNPRKQS